jgi:hypothetical protein
MSLRPLTDAREVKKAIASIKKNLARSCVQMRRFIGWQGGGNDFWIYWNPKLGMWWTLYRSSRAARYVCLFGFQDPTQSDNLTIICEVNPPYGEIDRRTAGVLLRDDAGRVFLAHSGKIGGGRPGIGKRSFIAACGRNQMESIVWPGGKISNVFVVGRVDSPRLAAQVQGFVSQVKEFKDSAQGDGRRRVSALLKTLFTPEFEGPRKPYRLTGKVESQCDHGLIVNRLKRILQEKFDLVGRDRERDLFVMTARRRITHLFEIKTDVSTSSVYGAVGQLMLHGSASCPAPIRILVVPGTPRNRTRIALKSLGIRILTYRLDGQRPAFAHLNKVLG